MKKLNIFCSLVMMSMLAVTSVSAEPLYGNVHADIQYYAYEFTEEPQTLTFGPVTFTDVTYYSQFNNYDTDWDDVEVVGLYIKPSGGQIKFEKDSDFRITDGGGEFAWNCDRVYVSMSHKDRFGYQYNDFEDYYNIDTSKVVSLGGDKVKTGSTLVVGSYESANVTSFELTVYSEGKAYYYSIIVEPKRGEYSGIVNENSVYMFPSTTIPRPDTNIPATHVDTTKPVEPTKPLEPAKPAVPDLPKAGTANITNAKMTVDGKEVTFEAYVINSNNYFMLRDIAYVVNGTSKQFGLQWDNEKKAVNMLTGQAYLPTGTELQTTTKTSENFTLYEGEIYQDGTLVSPTAFTFHNNNFFKLRDIATLFNFSVGWNQELQQISIETDKGYTLE